MSTFLDWRPATMRYYNGRFYIVDDPHVKVVTEKTSKKGYKSLQIATQALTTINSRRWQDAYRKFIMDVEGPKKNFVSG